MAGNKDQPPIVIRRVKKVVGGGHHGGAWKVAYADFVTAMMAFFMLLWLISSPDKEKLKGLAEYFTPGPPSAPMAMGATSGPSETIGMGGHTQRMASDNRTGKGVPSMTASTQGVSRGSNADVPSAAMRVLAEEMKLVIDTVSPESFNSPNVVTELGRDELRLSITDTARQSMFRGTTATLNSYGVSVLARLGKKLAPVKVQIAIEGHTDSAGGNNSDTNWRLSGERALAARNALIAGGVPADRFAQVIAMANTKPVYPEQPNRPENRRITIVLLAERSALPQDMSFKF